ncbi:hypothetical protein BDQ12DRAFT_629971 [Crucibulum laeve]|uniref:Potassium channel domain-containing protein n=1 Tax=Crucibulum laeve TaxID=68775 RepID=A0A5C3M272_9AGAR|nr:hypothetical protein BDQ12DRAFT_629971 [Crucibulum laeve]
MNDPGLHEPIQDSFNAATHTLADDIREHEEHSEPEHEQNADPVDDNESEEPIVRVRNELKNDESEEEVGFFQPTLWWFTSTAFPLISGTFGPIANLFSVCSLVQTWRIRTSDNGRIKDPAWLTALNAVSLFLAVLANLVLLFGFARRIRYIIAQPAVITLWYLSGTLLIVALSLTNTELLLDSPTLPGHILSQSFYYGLLAAILYFVNSTLLLVNIIGAYWFHAYPASYCALTIPQRTLMLQTISFSMYLALGAGVFSRLEGWDFVDGIYWADYTVLTIGLGSDFPLMTTAARMLLIPYAAFGVTLVGLVIGSVRGLVLERGKVKLARRRVGKERAKWLERMKGKQQRILLRRRKLPESVLSAGGESETGAWRRAEFELMRLIEESAEKAERYTALASSALSFTIVWIGGSLVFWSCQHIEKQGSWTYPEALYFSSTTLLTIGYGDFYPTSNADKPFFVLWTLIAVPTVTILISNMGDTVVRAVSEATVQAGRWTILPEKFSGDNDEKKIKKKHGKWKDITGKASKVDGQSGGDGGSKSLEGTPSTGPTGSSDSDSDVQHNEVKGLGADVEELGGAVEQAEEKQGRSGSLSARLAKEISHVARDIGKKPPRKYTWDEWVKWLELLDGREDAGKEGEDKEKDIKGKANDLVNVETDPAKQNKTKTWSWLGDEGPLFSKGSETEWILRRLCKRLEEALEEELDEKRKWDDEKKNSKYKSP